MQIIVTKENTTEQDPLYYYADASDLRLPPGTWPETLATTLLNGRAFRRATHPTAKGTGVGVIYEQPGTGAMLNIFND